ncbi:cellular nucleic acid-binding protein [Trifolium pratense]|uniref:Cellular nucleic acid-binding protein n=1 Tax=Trifolium pratense TaxID=57577 RepID=A0A2K3NZG3_TRIPR|nr:cellular nucleic acid-binding protein [Trifolium pratense]
MEFLSLTQGSMSIGDYAAKFEALIRFCPNYNTAEAEVSKCLKFEDGLRPEIKQFIAYRQIRQFPNLVDACRIYEETSQARSNHYKAISEKKHNGQDKGKPYDRDNQQERRQTTGRRETSGGEGPNSQRCYRCGAVGHRAFECKATSPTCFKCGKEGHLANECRSSNVVCFNCKEPRHISTQCQEPKKAKAEGKVLCLVGEEPETTAAKFTAAVSAATTATIGSIQRL